MLRSTASEFSLEGHLTIVLVPSPRMRLQHKIENPPYFTVLEKYLFSNRASTGLITCRQCVVNLWICVSSENMTVHHVSPVKLECALHHANLFFMCCFVSNGFLQPFFQKAQTFTNIAKQCFQTYLDSTLNLLTIEVGHRKGLLVKDK